MIIIRNSLLIFLNTLLMQVKYQLKQKFNYSLGFLLTNSTLKPYNQEISKTCKLFDCGHPDLNDFFANDVLNYSEELLGKTYCFTLDKDPFQTFESSRFGVRKVYVSIRMFIQHSGVQKWSIIFKFVSLHGTEYQTAPIRSILIVS